MMRVIEADVAHGGVTVEYVFPNDHDETFEGLLQLKLTARADLDGGDDVEVQVVKYRVTGGALRWPKPSPRELADAAILELGLELVAGNRVTIRHLHDVRDREYLCEVAGVYNSAPAGEATEAVVRHFGLSGAKSAGHLIDRVRRAGFLPATSAGKRSA